MQLLTGKKFNEKYNGLIFVKLTNESEIHNGFQFQTGENVDTIKFDPTGECKPGGLYFCEIYKLLQWINLGYNKMIYCRYVTITDDAQVYVEKDKFKADKFILSERIKVEDIDVWENEDYCRFAVKNYDYALKYIKPSTNYHQFCITSVKKNWDSVKYVNNSKIDAADLKKIYIEAVKRNANSLQYIKTKTFELCMHAVTKQGISLHYMDEKDYTEDDWYTIVMAAVENNGFALQYVNRQTVEICKAAFKQDKKSFEHVNYNLRKYVSH
jgi:hypothetical protein